MSQKLVQTGEQANSLPAIDIIRTETVLSRFPIHTLAKRGGVDINIVRKNDQGEVSLKWNVAPNPQHGIPRQLAYKLDTLVVNRRVDDLGRPLPRVIRLGSLRDLCAELGLSSGKTTNDVKKAILQNAATFITAKIDYKDREGQEQHLEAAFTRYSVVFTGKKLPGGEKADAVYLILNDPYWEVLNSAPARPLSYDYLRELPPMAQRFYEIVSYRMYGAMRNQIPEAKLAYSEFCTFSAQQRYFDYDHFKKQMYKVHKPHLASGYIRKVSYEAMTDEDGKPDWNMYYIPGPRASAEYKAFSKKRASKGESAQRREGGGEEAVALPDPAQEQAIELVSLFYTRFHGAAASTPQAKELKQAADLIVEVGEGKARFLVDFAYEKSQEDGYTPRVFGGILSFSNEAFAAYERQRTADKRKEQKRAEETVKERQQKEAWERDEKLLAELAPETREKLFVEAKDQFLAESKWAKGNADGVAAKSIIRGMVLEKLKGGEG